MSRTYIIALFVALSLLVPVAASARPLGDALRDTYATDDAGLRLLRDNGATLGRLLTLERVPTGKYVVEVAIQLEGATARYPLKFQRVADDWELVWQPEGVYAGALLAMLKNDGLPATAGKPWTDGARLPALPVIATRKRVVTPFGELPLPTSDGAGLGESPLLASAAQTWVSRVLDDDPAPAGVDLLLDLKLSWQTTNAVLFNLSMAGLYQVSVITRGGFAVRVAAPARQAAYVVALYPVDNGFGLRVAQNGTVVDGDGCAPEMTACVADAAGLPGLVTTHPPIEGPAMFAASGSLTVEQVLPFVSALMHVTAAQPHRLLIGYVQK